MVVFKSIISSYSISFKVDDSGVHHGILRCLVGSNVRRAKSIPLGLLLPIEGSPPSCMAALYQSKMSISFSYCLVSDMKWLGRLMAERGGGSRVDDCGLGLKEAVRGFDDRGLGLEGWLRIAVDGSNRFGRDWWPMGDGSRLRFRVDSLRFRLLLVLWFEGAMEAAKDFCRSGLRLGRKV
ncbi:hypothetical protein GW17_00044794 [Ensete ventricosum]|nr:hypothetical protein GW17_00044794 [Ensete ventricosum]